MEKLDLSRRHFLKSSVVAGVAIYIAPIGSHAFAALFEDENLTPVQWDAASGQAKFRVDGIAKVTGEKVFAYDMRASDLPHWPNRQAHALILRVTQADRIYDGFDLGPLGEELKPDRIVTAEDLANDGFTFPAFYGDDMLLPPGKTPAYLGQAVAIAIYHDFPRYRLAKDRLKLHDGVIRYGKHTGTLERDPWGAFRLVRMGGPTPYDEDVFSSLKDTPLFPGVMKKHQPIWPDGVAHGKLDEQGMFHAARIRQELDHPPGDWLVLDRDYVSQSTDMAALEPDNANCWYDSATRSLHMIVSTQSPFEVVEGAASMIASCRFPVSDLIIHPCHTVGYGSKDYCPMPFYGLIAGIYGDGRPVRLANDRFEHFQASLKRHSFKMRYRMAVDKKTALLQSFQGEFEADGGGRKNFSPSIAMVAAIAAQSVYYFPKSDFSTVAIASRAVDAGAARGYGTLQSMAATEMMIDEMAGRLGVDPIDFRLTNALLSGMRNTQGAIPAGALRVDEVLQIARVHPLWTGRAKKKIEFESTHPGQRYGVGFACVQKDFGTGSESAFAKVEFTADGRISLHHTTTEIGTGASTSQAIVVAKWLGKPAMDVHLAVTEWVDLPVATSGNPYLMSQTEQDELSDDPRWSPGYASPASASNSAFYAAHSTREAARIVFVHGLWPAALSLWSQGIDGGQIAPLSIRIEDARWVDGRLSAGGLQPLRFEQLARKVHELGLVAGATVHAFNRWQWAEAEFTIDGRVERLPLDGLSLRYGDDAVRKSGATPNQYHVLDRERVFMPPVRRNQAAVAYYSAAGTLVELTVHKDSGQVELLSHHSILECGKQISPQLVSGQLQGGIAMGIGHALHEYLPLYEDGPGNGKWNFDRYHLPRARDVGVWTQTADVLPPLTETDVSKGMAEVVMIPVVGAIVNGIAHAIGHRFTDLPVTPEKIKGVFA